LLNSARWQTYASGFFIGKFLFNGYNWNMENLSIFGVKISNLSKESALERVKAFLSDGGQHFIVTPNPEILLAAGKDEEFFYILNCADLSLGDGIGLKIAGWFEGCNLKRLTGADFTADILKIAAEEKVKVGILLWQGGLSKKTEVEKVLREKYPALVFFVASGSRESETALNEDFLKFKPEIVFVAFGAPWQEKFIFHNLKKIPSARLAVGIGGTFDFLTGRRKRAPKLFRVLGFEWLWRLAIQPQRYVRILNAVFIFPWKFLKRKFFYPLLYRPNVACLLYKKTGDKYKVLIMERREEPGHWQIPQGGTEGEKLLVSGARELREEANTDKFIAKRVFKNIYRYKFGNRPGETSERAETRQRHTNYKGQNQGLFIAEFTGRDEDIKVNFWDHSDWKWVDSDKLVDSVHLIRKRATARFLKKFKEFVKIK
jgi:N-acetylglucosaminyldiphosphoundecaprenol N-acetyl-beta-D-mannosaminyltransferase